MKKLILLSLLVIITIIAAGCETNFVYSPVCGNSLVESGEQCDDGNTIDGDGCPNDCQGTLFTCKSSDGGDYAIIGGNLTIFGPDGNDISGYPVLGYDMCESTTRLNEWSCRKNNGYYKTSSAAQTDLLKTTVIECSTYMPNYVCDQEMPGACIRPPPICGNSIVESGEQCDDGNTIDGDGCPNDCQGTLFTCKDSDGGDYAIGGNLTIFGPDGNDISGYPVLGYDMCESTTRLNEWACGKNDGYYKTSSVAQTDLLKTTVIDCSKYRFDYYCAQLLFPGACLPLVRGH